MTTSLVEARPHTAAELAAVLRLLERLGANSIVLGYSREDATRSTAESIAEAWSRRGGIVLDSVDWPESAASWLRQARRFTTPAPDAWVVSARPQGWAGMSRRLVESTAWEPRRTVMTASLSGADILSCGAPTNYSGLRGVTGEGQAWEIGRRSATTTATASQARQGTAWP